MATGDVTIFDEFVLNVGQEKHLLGSGNDTLKLGLIDNVATPTAGDTTPTWSDYSANEVSTAGNYTANGETLANVSFTEAGGTATLDADDVTVLQDAGGFTDAYWGILYNDTEATDMAIAFVELGGPVSEQAGDVTVSWNASGILTIATA